jgi:hypothetical protein
VPRKKVEYIPVTRKPHSARADEAAQAQDPQRHDRVRDPRFEGEEGRHQRAREGAEAEYLHRAPAEARSLDDRVDGGHQRERDEQGAEPVDALARCDCFVAGEQRPAKAEGGDADRQVDEEDPMPVERLGERAAGEQAERAAGDGDEDIRAHGLGAVLGEREFGDDDREDHRRRQRAANALDEARRNQQSLARGEPAKRRGDRERDDADEEYALAPKQVAKASGEQKEAAERDQERVDDPGQVALREMEVALDRRQRHVDDRRVEDDHQLRQADHHQGKPAPLIAAGTKEGKSVHGALRTVETGRRRC